MAVSKTSMHEMKVYYNRDCTFSVTDGSGIWGNGDLIELAFFDFQRNKHRELVRKHEKASRTTG